MGAGRSRRHGPAITGAALSLVATLLLSMVLVLTISSEVSAAIWQAEQEISTDATTEPQGSPSIVAGDDKVHIVWEDRGDGDDDIYYRYFDGTGWQPEAEVSMGPFSTQQNSPSLALDGNELHVAWEDSRVSGVDIYYRSFDGSNWQSELQINANPAGDDYMNPCVAADGGEVHVVWNGGPSGESDIFYRHFDGAAWQPQLEISSDAATERQIDPSIAVDGNTRHVVWADWSDGDYDIYYLYHDGVDWQSEFEISTDTGNENQVRTAIAAEGGRVHVLWDDQGGGDGDIYYRLFDGTTWQPEIQISSDVGAEEQYSSAIAIDGDRVHVMWVDEGDGDRDIYYRYFDGTIWLPEVQISTDSAAEGQLKPSIALDGSRIHVAWADDDGADWDILYRMGVEDHTPPQSDAGPIAKYWKSSSDFSVGWTASDDYDLANISLYFRHSSDNATWSAWQEIDHNDTIFGTSAGGKFAFVGAEGEGYYEFYTIANDSFGNLEAVPPAADAIAGADVTAPTGSIVIDDGNQWATSTSVTLTLTYSDSLSGVSDIRFSNNDTWDTEPWESPSATKSWELTSGEGTKMVYYQVRDVAGHESTTYSDDIELDATAPTVESVSPLDGATDVGVTTSVIVTFSEAMDESDTEDSFSLRVDSTDVSGTFSWSGNSRTMTFTPTNDLEEGTTYQVIVSTVAEDAAGNNLDSAEQTSFTTEGEAVDGAAVDDYWWMFPLIVLLVIIIIVVIILALVLRSRRAPPQAEPLPPEPEAPPEWQDEAPPAPPEPP